MTNPWSTQCFGVLLGVSVWLCAQPTAGVSASPPMNEARQRSWQQPVHVEGPGVTVEVQQQGIENDYVVFNIRIATANGTRIVRMKNRTIEVDRLVLGDAGTLLVLGSMEFDR